MKNNIDRFTFFESYDAVFETIRKTKSENEIDALKKEIFLFRALRDFVFRGIEPENFPSVELKMVWEILKPNLINSIEIEERNAKLRENGRKGGRPKSLVKTKNENLVKTKNENLVKPKNEPWFNQESNLGLTKNENLVKPEKEKEKGKRNKENEGEEEEEIIPVPAAVEFVNGEPVASNLDVKRPTEEEVTQYIKDKGFLGYVNPRRFLNYYEKRNWILNGIPVNWQVKLEEWAYDERSKELREMRKNE